MNSILRIHQHMNLRLIHLWCYIRRLSNKCHLNLRCLFPYMHCFWIEQLGKHLLESEIRCYACNYQWKNPYFISTYKSFSPLTSNCLQRSRRFWQKRHKSYKQIIANIFLTTWLLYNAPWYVSTGRWRIEMCYKTKIKIPH